MPRRMGRKSWYVIFWISEVTISRAMRKTLSPEMDGLFFLMNSATLLCSRTQMVCMTVRADCSFTLKSPARKQGGLGHKTIPLVGSTSGSKGRVGSAAEKNGGKINLFFHQLERGFLTR